MTTVRLTAAGLGKKKKKKEKKNARIYVNRYVYVISRKIFVFSIKHDDVEKIRRVKIH